AQRNLAILDINQYFSDINGSDRVVAFKPLPGGLLQAMREHNIDYRQAVMIGDATFDIDAGNAAGIDTIAVTWGSHDQAILEK
ncbi:HAD family hydrolase, partial [Leuconostoc suionicum]|uniref:HAD family hydrolase n=1 Tax=Leuconostoc suionicum TaxID=1511761 RepID=UPI00300D9967